METRRWIVRRYYAYCVTTSIGLYLPVAVVFLTEVRDFGLEAVGTIMAAYLIAMLLAEIPTGYVGDRVGRRLSLAIGNALMASAMFAWVFLQTPLQYVLVNAVWASGTAFRSGTASAWLYELLDANGEADHFARISGRGSTARLLASATGALAAGALVTYDWSLPFLANAGLAALGLPILATFPAVDGDATGGPEETPFRVGDAVRTLRVQAGRPDVRWFVAYTALFYGVYQLAIAFEQPAMRAAGVPLVGLGVVYAGFKVVSAGAASTAGWLQDRLGARGVYALLGPVVGATFAGAAVWPLLVVPALFVCRGVNVAVRPIRDQYLNDRLEDAGRATALSGVSMVLALFAAGLDVLGGVVAETVGPVRFLAAAGVTAAGVAGILWFALDPVRTTASPPVGRTDEALAND